VKEKNYTMLETKRLGTYAPTIDENGIKLASSGNSTISLTHANALELADFILAHRTDIETMQKQHAGETITPPATEPE
jgi:hypothetical protein